MRNLTTHKNTLVSLLVNNHSAVRSVSFALWRTNPIPAARLNTRFEVAEEIVSKSKCLFSSPAWLFLRPIKKLFIQKTRSVIFSFYTSQPSSTQEITADSSAISQPWLTTSTRRFKKKKKRREFAIQLEPLPSRVSCRTITRPWCCFQKPSSWTSCLVHFFQFTGEGTDANGRVCGWM